eukprot:4748510-Amphidinium_carterae.1
MEACRGMPRAYARGVSCRGDASQSGAAECTLVTCPSVPNVSGANSSTCPSEVRKHLPVVGGQLNGKDVYHHMPSHQATSGELFHATKEHQKGIPASDFYYTQWRKILNSLRSQCSSADVLSMGLWGHTRVVPAAFDAGGGALPFSSGVMATCLVVVEQLHGQMSRPGKSAWGPVSSLWRYIMAIHARLFVWMATRLREGATSETTRFEDLHLLLLRNFRIVSKTHLKRAAHLCLCWSALSAGHGRIAWLCGLSVSTTATLTL